MNYFKNYQNIKLNDAEVIKNILKRYEKEELKKLMISKENDDYLENEEEKKVINFLKNLDIQLDNISSIKQFHIKHHKDEIKTIDNDDIDKLNFKVLKITPISTGSGNSGIVKSFYIPCNINDLNKLIQFFVDKFGKSNAAFLKEIARSNNIYWYGYTKSSFVNGSIVVDQSFKKDANEKYINPIKVKQLSTTPSATLTTTTTTTITTTSTSTSTSSKRKWVDDDDEETTVVPDENVEKQQEKDEENNVYKKLKTTHKNEQSQPQPQPQQQLDDKIEFDTDIDFVQIKVNETPIKNQQQQENDINKTTTENETVTTPSTPSTFNIFNQFKQVFNKFKLGSKK